MTKGSQRAAREQREHAEKLILGEGCLILVQRVNRERTLNLVRRVNLRSSVQHMGRARF